MKERSILMSPGNAVATGNETKTQTRRLLSSKQVFNDDPARYKYHGTNEDHDFFFEDLAEDSLTPWFMPFKSPYGQPGDRLWIKESFYAYGIWIKRDKLTKTGKPKHQFVDHSHYDNVKRPHPHNYRYSDNPPDEIKTGYTSGLGWYKRPSMFMPRIASRYAVEIVNVRIEQLGDITAADAIAEGIKRDQHEGEKLYYFYPCNDLRDDSYLKNPITSYYSLWISINGAGSWNPELWVWVIEYKLINNGSAKE